MSAWVAPACVLRQLLRWPVWLMKLRGKLGILRTLEESSNALLCHLCLECKLSSLSRTLLHDISRSLSMFGDTADK